MKEKIKKYDLLLAIGIIFGLFIILSYIIPVGYYSYDENYNLSYIAGETEPVGLIGLFKSPIYSVAIFIQYIVVFVMMGILYSVMNKTGVYKKLVDKTVQKFNTHKSLFLIISIITFSLLASLSGLPVLLFVLVPFVTAVILLLGYDKLTALASTVGATLIGTMGSTYGNALVDFGLDANNLILVKFILFVVLTFLLVMFVIAKTKKASKQIEVVETPKKRGRKSKNEEIKKEMVEIPFYDDAEVKEKSIVPLVIIFALFLIISFVAMFNWEYALKIDLFSNLTTSINEFKIFGISIFSKILGNFTTFGNWGNYEFAAFILFVTIIIGWVYGLKPKEFIETCETGIKKMLKPALYVAFACVIFAIMVNGQNGNISSTIINAIMGLSESFNVLLTTLSGTIGSIFYNDYIYLSNGIFGAIGSFSSAYPIINIILQESFGFAMLILPVSTILVAGLKYLNVSYTDWLKYMWMLLLELFVIIILTGLILTLIV